MRFIAIATAVLGGMLCLSAPARAEVVVIVSQSQQQLAVTVDGQELYRWPVSTGRPGYETPDGEFHAKSINREWYSREYELTPMPWSVFFHKGYALHGTLEARHLGRAVSHGCVRLEADKAAILFGLVSGQGLENTKVVISERPLPRLPQASPTLIAMLEHSALEQIGIADMHGGGERVAAKVEAAPEQAEVQAPRQVKLAEPIQKIAPSPELAPREARLEAKLTEPDLQDVRLPQPAPPRRVEPPQRLGADRRDEPRRYATARGDEATVMREREAWLRGLAHKYGYERW